MSKTKYTLDFAKSVLGSTDDKDGFHKVWFEFAVKREDKSTLQACIDLPNLKVQFLGEEGHWSDPAGPVEAALAGKLGKYFAQKRFPGLFKKVEENLIAEKVAQKQFVAATDLPKKLPKFKFSYAQVEVEPLTNELQGGGDLGLDDGDKSDEQEDIVQEPKSEPVLDVAKFDFSEAGFLHVASDKKGYDGTWLDNFRYNLVDVVSRFAVRLVGESVTVLAFDVSPEPKLINPDKTDIDGLKETCESIAAYFTENKDSGFKDLFGAANAYNAEIQEEDDRDVVLFNINMLPKVMPVPANKAPGQGEKGESKNWEKVKENAKSVARVAAKFFDLIVAVPLGMPNILWGMLLSMGEAFSEIWQANVAGWRLMVNPHDLDVGGLKYRAHNANKYEYLVDHVKADEKIAIAGAKTALNGTTDDDGKHNGDGILAVLKAFDKNFSFDKLTEYTNQTVGDKSEEDATQVVKSDVKKELIKVTWTDTSDPKEDRLPSITYYVSKSGELYMPVKVSETLNDADESETKYTEYQKARFVDMSGDNDQTPARPANEISGLYHNLITANAKKIGRYVDRKAAQQKIISDNTLSAKTFFRGVLAVVVLSLNTVLAPLVYVPVKAVVGMFKGIANVFSRAWNGKKIGGISNVFKSYNDLNSAPKYRGSETVVATNEYVKKDVDGKVIVRSPLLAVTPKGMINADMLRGRQQATVGKKEKVKDKDGNVVKDKDGHDQYIVRDQVGVVSSRVNPQHVLTDRSDKTGTRFYIVGKAGYNYMPLWLGLMTAAFVVAAVLLAPVVPALAPVAAFVTQILSSMTAGIVALPAATAAMAAIAGAVSGVAAIAAGYVAQAAVYLTLNVLNAIGNVMRLPAGKATGTVPVFAKVLNTITGAMEPKLVGYETLTGKETPKVVAKENEKVEDEVKPKTPELHRITTFSQQAKVSMKATFMFACAKVFRKFYQPFGPDVQAADVTMQMCRDAVAFEVVASNTPALGKMVYNVIVKPESKPDGGQSQTTGKDVKDGETSVKPESYHRIFEVPTYGDKGLGAVMGHENIVQAIEVA